jgi:hypothetical protein
VFNALIFASTQFLSVDGDSSDCTDSLYIFAAGTGEFVQCSWIQAMAVGAEDLFNALGYTPADTAQIQKSTCVQGVAQRLQSVLCCSQQVASHAQPSSKSAIANLSATSIGYAADGESATDVGPSTNDLSARNLPAANHG